MANLHKFDLQTLPAMAWKNGGGVTREIVREPAGASLDDFDWRVSVADIAAAGPFSRFVGVDRHLLLLEGDGVNLTSAEAGLDVSLLADGTVLAFSGDVDMGSQLLGGAVRDDQARRVASASGGVDCGRWYSCRSRFDFANKRAGAL